MDDNKKVLILLNQSKGDTPRLTNTQNFFLLKALDNADLQPLDLFDEKKLQGLDIKGIRNQEDVKQKISSLLSQRADIAWKIDKWKQSGIFILTYMDNNYPANLNKKLHQKAPAVIYGLGNIDNLAKDGIAVVGSRSIDKEIIDYTSTIAKKLCSEEIAVISGGAKGVDITAMEAALQNGGTALAFLKQKFSFRNLSRSGWNKFLEDGSLTLLTEVPPDMTLTREMSISAAMNRNKYIYALARFGIVISSDISGGTWSGALEQIKKYNNNVFILNHPHINKKGNKLLLEKYNALPLPDFKDRLVEKMEIAFNCWQKDKKNSALQNSQMEIVFN